MSEARFLLIHVRVLAYLLARPIHSSLFLLPPFLSPSGPFVRKMRVAPDRPTINLIALGTNFSQSGLPNAQNLT